MYQLANSVQPTNPPKLAALSQKILLQYFEDTWRIYEVLFSAIQVESAYYSSPDPLRNPLIFYWGHTAAFYINKLKMAGLIDKGVDERFDQLFAVGVDPALPEELKGQVQWPSLTEVNIYRDKIYAIVKTVIQTSPIPSQITPSDPAWAILMGLEHDRIHFETSSVLIRQLDESYLSRPEAWVYASSAGNSPALKWVNSKGGIVHLGKPDVPQIFGWDNEFGTYETKVNPFAVSAHLITNQQFLDFFKSGAYQDQSYWSAAGWNWKNRTDTQHPKFWIPTNGSVKYRAMFDELEMPLDWPVEVNAYEAEAYCNWMGPEIRLMSEAEFTLLARQAKANEYDPALNMDHNLHFRYGSSTPVGFADLNPHPDGIYDLYGNVWDWLSNDFYPLDGFTPHPFYMDFSAPYMDNEHGMMAGGSWATSGTGASKYYRLWFRRYFYQHAGFRLAKSL